MFEGKYSLAIDVWSSGVILYVMLSGVFPWKMDGGMEDIIEQAKQGKYEFPAETWGSISPDAQDLVCSMIELSPTKRLSTAKCLKHPWLERARLGDISDAAMPAAQHRMRSASIISAEQMVDFIPTASAGVSRRNSRKSSVASARSGGVGTKTPLSGAKKGVVEVVQSSPRGSAGGPSG